MRSAFGLPEGQLRSSGEIWGVGSVRQSGVDQSEDGFRDLGEVAEQPDGIQHASLPGTSDLSAAWLAARQRQGGDFRSRAPTESRPAALVRLTAGAVAPGMPDEVRTTSPGVRYPQLRPAMHASRAGVARADSDADDAGGCLAGSYQRWRVTPLSAAQAVRHRPLCPSRSSRVPRRARVPRALFGAMEEST